MPYNAKFEFSKLLLRPDIAQLFKQIRDMGIGVIPEPKPYHNQILIGIYKEDLTPDTHCIIAWEVRLVGADATGVVPAEVIALIILGISRRLLNPGFAHNPLSVPNALIQIKPANLRQIQHGQGQPAEGVGCVMLLAII